MEESQFLQHEPCPSCGSKDNLARYDDGHGYCFGCDYYEQKESNGETSWVAPLSTTGSSEQKEVLKVEGETRAISSRRITEETSSKWGYRLGEYNGSPAHLAYYYDKNRRPIAAKVRYPDKTFHWIGDSKNVGLYGDWLWRDSGKMIVVTEGEIDALSVSQLQNNKYPVVSVPNGAQGASRAIRKSITFLEKFEKVVFMFDMDDVGKDAALECAKLLSPGKAHIAHIDLKDPNEMLVAGRGADVIDAIWGAKQYRPDGIINAADLWDTVRGSNDSFRVPYPFSGLNTPTYGVGLRELTTITAGTGVGKSAFVREIAYDLLMNKDMTVGMMMLEEGLRRTMQGMLGIHMNKVLHVDSTVDEGELRKSFDAVTKGNRLHLYDSFGSTDPDVLIEKLRYMAVGLGCDFIIFDHISIAIAGLDVDDRKALDMMVTKLRSLVEETGVGLLMVAHLRRLDGNKGHENGVTTSLSHLRGSQSIAQTSDVVIGLERDQQGENRNITTVRILKNRFSGITGECCQLKYDEQTGRLTEVTTEAFQDGDIY